ncbi:MAG: hypothetical protein BM556_11635 [Bacteriovorax sp. MedPE-SWde]|nr:MAG: hypothetical protein BM556_11635 [Bacteriovorax sp. MedPE-SWde]
MKFIIIALTFSMAWAECSIHYNRTACDGLHRSGKTNAEMSYKKCKGKKECTKTKAATSLSQCQEAAMNSCKNRRFDITKSKVITATWKGSEIKSKEGNKDFCLTYKNRATEFNQCSQ